MTLNEATTESSDNNYKACYFWNFMVYTVV